MVAVVASAAVYFFPMIWPLSETNPLFRYIGLLPMYHAQFVSLMSVEQMSNGVFYAVWAIPAAVIFIAISVFASRRVFAKHQVS
jgi:multidrug transporter EmrE-like cation transporter